VHTSSVSCTDAYLSDSFFPDVFLRFGVGILQSIENATQFVHGTPRLAASHRTCNESKYGRERYSSVGRIAPCAHDMSNKELAGFIQYRMTCTHFTSSRCALPTRRSAISPLATIHVNAPPEARMSRTLFFRHITSSIARAEASGRAHVSDGSRIVHRGRRCTRYAWPERRCRESRRGVGETTASARGASDLTPLQASLARPRVSDHD